MADVVAGQAFCGALLGGGGAAEDGAAGGGFGVANVDEGEDAGERSGNKREAEAGAGAADQLGADHRQLG